MKKILICQMMIVSVFGFGVALGQGPQAERSTERVVVQPAERIGIIDSRGLNPSEIQAVKSDTRLTWWLELTDQLMIRAAREDLRSMAKSLPMYLLPMPADDNALLITGQPVPPEWRSYQVVVEDHRFAVIDTRFVDPTFDPNQDFAVGCHAEHGMAFPLTPNRSLSYRPAPEELAKKRRKVDEIDALVDQADVVRWYNDLFYLSCHNRWTGSETISDATYWLQDRFRQIPGLQVSLQSFPVGGTMADNVIAVLPGTETPDDWYIVGAHYDSISRSPATAAPGAEDNASGTAGVLELARLFAANPPKATIIFICFSGEEQGLFGSNFYAQGLVDNGDDAKVRAMLNMDMISFTSQEQLQILLETSSTAEFLTGPFLRAAETYTDLNMTVSLNPFGSDHVPFLQRGIPALLVIDTEYAIYPGYHRVSDTAEKIVLEQGWDVLRMNAAALAEMAGIPGVDPQPPVQE